MAIFVLRFLLPLAVALSWTAAAFAQPSAEAGASAAREGFTVGGIAVDIQAATSDEAREQAFREAPRAAWPRLWARLTGRSEAAAPGMSDAALSAMVDGIVVEEERIGGGRYIATLGVSFDRRRAGRRLPAGARILQSEPVLLIPLLADAGSFATFDQDSEWYQSWREASLGGSIDYVQPNAGMGDRIVTPGWQALRSHRRAWRTVLDRYRAENVLIAEARIQRTYPGGPIGGVFTARYGPDAKPLGSFRLRAASTGEYADMLSNAVARMDALYGKALERGLLESEEQLSLSLAALRVPDLTLDDGQVGLGTVNLLVAILDAEEWGQIEAILQSIPAVQEVEIRSFVLGGNSRLALTYNGSEGELRRALSNRGYRLTATGDGYDLRPRSDPAPVEAFQTVGDGVNGRDAAPADPDGRPDGADGADEDGADEDGGVGAAQDLLPGPEGEQ
jgi:hypothetical protein